MPCPTCDHTLQRISAEYFYCPRCGTIKEDVADSPFIYAPKLVTRVREYTDTLNNIDFNQDSLSVLIVKGVVESCYLPDDRPVIDNT